MTKKKYSIFRMRKGPFGRYIVATRDIQPLGIF